jgi:anti-sigma28 factor (negative regulator of flagellin synthesis)
MATNKIQPKNPDTTAKKTDTTAKKTDTTRDAERTTQYAGTGVRKSARKSNSASWGR